LLQDVPASKDICVYNKTFMLQNSDYLDI